jgi:virulence-associated protein VapD
MFAISFDMVISDLKTYYGEPYNRAYFEIKILLEHYGFEWIQGSTYLT